jgi:hypothetical protein
MRPKSECYRKNIRKTSPEIYSKLNGERVAPVT